MAMRVSAQDAPGIHASQRQYAALFAAVLRDHSKVNDWICLDMDVPCQSSDSNSSMHMSMQYVYIYICIWLILLQMCTLSGDKKPDTVSMGRTSKNQSSVIHRTLDSMPSKEYLACRSKETH